MSDSRYFEMDDRGDVLVLRVLVAGLDRSVANEFGADLLSVLDRCSGGRVVINLSEVHKISAPVLAKLMTFDKRLSADGGSLLICGAAPDVQQIISLAWPGRWTEEPTTEAAAIAALDGSSPTESG